MTTTGAVDAYIAGLPPATAAIVDEVRHLAHRIRPDAIEVLRYGIPTFQVDGRSRVHVAGWTDHVSIYPMPAAADVAHDLTPYRSGKSTLKFPLSQGLPWPIVEEVLRALLA